SPCNRSRRASNGLSSGPIWWTWGASWGRVSFSARRCLRRNSSGWQSERDPLHYPDSEVFTRTGVSRGGRAGGARDGDSGAERRRPGGEPGGASAGKGRKERLERAQGSLEGTRQATRELS